MATHDEAHPRARGLPDALARVENRVVRPRDFATLYGNHWAEFARLVDRGLLAPIAHGYYALVPEGDRGGHWKPPVEAVGLGIAIADYGITGAALMGITAARVLGAVPRALNAAVVAVPRQRRALDTEFGRVQFVKRAIPTLQVQRADTALVVGYATGPEQTVLDLAARPELGGVTEATTQDAIRALWPRCDEAVLGELAHRQLKQKVLVHLYAVVERDEPAE